MGQLDSNVQSPTERPVRDVAIPDEFASRSVKPGNHIIFRLKGLKPGAFRLLWVNWIRELCTAPPG
jgi:hypothetical protein